MQQPAPHPTLSRGSVLQGLLQPLDLGAHARQRLFVRLKPASAPRGLLQSTPISSSSKGLVPFQPAPLNRASPPGSYSTWGWQAPTQQEASGGGRFSPSARTDCTRVRGPAPACPKSVCPSPLPPAPYHRASGAEHEEVSHVPAPSKPLPQCVPATPFPQRHTEGLAARATPHGRWRAPSPRWRRAR